MKNTFITSIFILNLTLVLGQAPQNQISILRANDNFTSVKTDSVKKGFNKLKHIKLGENVNISFGGELREQFQHFDNSNFGDTPPNFKSATFNQVWHRVMLHSNLELGSKVRLFTQLSSTLRFFNDNPLTPEIDENSLSLHQAFLDYSFHNNWILRVGRQEMGYGNNRILTFREGPNTRLTFDAVILKYQNEKRKIDFLALTPVISREDVFDDTSFKDAILGVYATETIIPKKFLLDYYFVNFKSNQRRYNFVGGEENRQSYGFRVFSQDPKFNYELEGTYQSGKFNNLTIDAFGFSADLNYKFIEKHKFTIGLGANYFTGDKNRTDGKLNTYNLIFSKPSYGLAAPIGSSNIENLNPYIKFYPIKKLSTYLGVYFMKRQSNLDGTYSPGMAQVRPNPNILFTTSNREIGQQYAFETMYEFNQHISFAIDSAYFKAGEYVSNTGKGKDIKYVSCKATFKF